MRAAAVRGVGTGFSGRRGIFQQEAASMADVAFLSTYFSGASGALVMSFIAMSIVFLVIIGLMMVMLGTNRLVGTFDKKSSEAK